MAKPKTYVPVNDEPVGPALIGTMACEFPGCDGVADVHDHGNGKYVATHILRRVGLKPHVATYGSYVLTKVTLK